MFLVINLVLSIICWLGVFQPHLIQPLMVLPVSTALANLTIVDYAQLAGTFIVISLVMEVFDHFTKRKPSTVGYEALRRGPESGN